MDNIVEYLIKSGIALSVFYLFYWLLMRKSTHFSLNRLTLATSLIASLVLPLIKIDLTPDVVAANIPVMSMDLSTVVQIVSKPEPFWGLREIVLLIYFAGLAITLFRLIYQSIYIHVISKMSRTITKGRHTIVLVEKDITPFAYFSKIFIPASKMEETSFESILAHEKSHLSQYHFIDLFLIEVVTIIQWFNPIVWLYERSLKEVHEYMADEEVLKQGVSKGNYQALLVNQALGGPVFTISHQFNQSLILKRIVMMTKMKSPQLAKIRVLLFIPLTAILLMAFSNPEHIVNPVVEKVGTLTQQITGINILPDNSTSLNISDSEKGPILIKGKVVDASTSKPIEGVSIIIQGTNTGTTTDKNGAFKIKSESSDLILMFSHIGFNTSFNEFKSDNNNAIIQMVKNVQELTEVVVSYPNENQSIKPTPYYVLDGAPSDEATVKALLPDAIESVSVLKDESATIHYGEKGKNGVVLITTKKGNATEDNSGKNKNIIIKQGVKIEISDKEGVFTVVEQLPSFPGGENERVKFLSNNLKVPSEGLKEGLEGTVYVTFVVKEDGSIKDAKILRGLGKTYDEEVLRVVNLMPAWLPGVQRGKAVAVQFNMPVKFSKDK
jgi:TonB family protein